MSTLRRGNGLRYCPGCQRQKGEGQMQFYDREARRWIQMDRCRDCQTSIGRTRRP